MMNSGICVVGSINVDLITRTQRLPRRGETIFGQDFHLAMGGKGANQAVTVARLGGSVEFVGCVGDDLFGRMALDGLRGGGVEVGQVRVHPAAPTGVALIMVVSEGDNAIIVTPGANMENKTEDADRALEKPAGFGLLLLQLEIPMEVIVHSARRARELGLTVVLDAGPAVRCPPELFEYIDIISPNETETEAIIGRPVPTVAKARAAAAELLKRGPRGVVIKLGQRGCLVADGDGMTHLPAHRVKVVDTTAAGDVFSGAMSLALAGGESLRQAAGFGNAAAALAVTRLGAQPSIPTRDEVRSFLAAVGVER